MEKKENDNLCVECGQMDAPEFSTICNDCLKARLKDSGVFEV